MRQRGKSSSLNLKRAPVAFRRTAHQLSIEQHDLDDHASKDLCLTVASYHHLQRGPS